MLRAQCTLLLAVLSLWTPLASLPSLHAEEADEAEADAFRARLADVRLNLSLQEALLPEVVQLLGVQTGVNVHLDPRVRYDLEDVLIRNLHVKDVPLTTLLDLVVEAGGEEIVWATMGNIVVITTREFAPRALSSRVYVVASLTSGFTNLPSVPFGETALAGDATFRALETADEAFFPFGSADELIELIMGSVHPAFWEETEGAGIASTDEDRLVITASKEVHRAVEAFLRHLQRLRLPAVQVELYAVQVPDDRASQLDRNAAGPRLAEADAERLLAHATVGPAFLLAVRPGGEARGFAGICHDFLAGFDVREEGDRVATDPRMETVDHGIRLRVHAEAAPMPGRILLGLDVALMELSSIREHAGNRGVELPVREIVARSSVLELEPRAWHWTEGPLSGGFVLLVRATPVKPSEAEGSGVGLAVPEPTLPAATRQRLDKIRLERMHLQEASLAQMMSALARLSGQNIVIAPRVWVEMGDDYVADLDLKDVPLRAALDALTEPWGLRWEDEDGLIRIDVAYERGRAFELRYFDVRDIGEGIVRRRHLDRGEDWRAESNHEAVPLFSDEVLVELIRETVGGEEDWEDPASIEARSGILIARNRPEVLDAVDRLLASIRASRTVVATTVDLLESDEPFFLELLMGGSRDAPAWTLSGADVERIEKAVAAGSVERLHRERVVSVSGSSVPRSHGTVAPYVGDYDVHPALHGSVTVPQVRRAFSGTSLRLRTVPGFMRDTYVELRMAWSSYEALREIRVPGIGTIEVPTVKRFLVETGLTVPDGETVVVGLGRSDGRTRVLLLTARRVSKTR